MSKATEQRKSTETWRIPSKELREEIGTKLGFEGCIEVYQAEKHNPDKLNIILRIGRGNELIRRP